MDIGRWDYIRGRNFDRLTHKQGVIRLGLVQLCTIPIGFGITVWTGLVEADSALEISGGMVAACLVVTAFRLVRKERAEPDAVTLPPEEVARLAR